MRRRRGPRSGREDRIGLSRRLLLRRGRQRPRERAGDVRRDREAVWPHRRPLQQCGHHAGRRRLDPDHRAGRLRPRPGSQREGRVPVLQVRHPSPAQGRRRLGDQCRLVRRHPRRGHVSDRIHGLERRGACDEPRAGGAIRAPGRAGQRSVPGAGGDAALDADLQ